jgi:hypothetical protein
MIPMLNFLVVMIEDCAQVIVTATCWNLAT